MTNRWRAKAVTTVVILLLCGLFVSCGGDEGATSQEPEIADRAGAEIVRQYGPDDDADRMVLEQLAAAGSDLEKPTNVRWYVYLTDATAAEAFEVRAKEAGYRTELRRSEAETWLCLCAKTVVPSATTIHTMREELVRLAASPSANIDGWEAAIQR